MKSQCPACYRLRDAQKYLCSTCWGRLPVETRGALKRRDQRAMARLRKLHDEIAQGRPLPWIKIS